MKTTSLTAVLLVLSGLMLTSFELIGDIFGAGFYTGIFVVVLFLVNPNTSLGRHRRRFRPAIDGGGWPPYP